MNLVFLLVFSAVTAQASSFDALYRSALGHASELGISRARSQAARREVDRARAAFFPRLEASTTLRSWAQASPQDQGTIVRPDRQTVAELGLEQPLFQGGTAWNGWRQAHHRSRARAHAGTARRREVLHMTGTLAYSLLEAREAASQARAEVKRRKAHREDAEKRRAVGALTEAAVARAQAEEQKALADEIEAERKVLEAEAGLARIAGFSLPADAEPPDPLPLEGGRIELAQKASSSNPAVLSAGESLKAARSGVLKARGSFLPTVSVGGALRRHSESPHTLQFIRNEAVGFLTARWALFSGGEKRASEQAARARREEAAARLRSARESWELKARTSWDAVRAAEANIAAQESRYEAAQTSYDRVKKRHGAGLDPYLNLLDASTERRTAETSLRRARFSRERAVLDLYLAAGTIERAVLAN